MLLVMLSESVSFQNRGKHDKHSDIVFEQEGQRMLEFDLNLLGHTYVLYHHRQAEHHHESHPNMRILELSNLRLFTVQHDHHGN